MAQVSKICSGVRTPQFLHEIPKSQKPNSVNLFSVRSPFVGASSFRGLKYGDEMRRSSAGGRVSAIVPLRVSASAATTEKPPTVPEIVLQPIKEISGTIHLPGSKSLSNRILLLAALSEVCMIVEWFEIYILDFCDAYDQLSLCAFDRLNNYFLIHHALSEAERT